MAELQSEPDRLRLRATADVWDSLHQFVDRKAGELGMSCEPRAVEADPLVDQRQCVEGRPDRFLGAPRSMSSLPTPREHLLHPEAILGLPPSTAGLGSTAQNSFAESR